VFKFGRAFFLFIFFLRFIFCFQFVFFIFVFILFLLSLAFLNLIHISYFIVHFFVQIKKYFIPFLLIIVNFNFSNYHNMNWNRSNESE